jgi:cytochrome c
MTKKALVALALAVCSAAPAWAASTTSTASAADGRQLAEQKHCFVCHDVANDKFAPSFRDIARRFGGLRNARQMLVYVVQGGTDSAAIGYHWGRSKMPPSQVRVPVDQAEAEILVDYVLSQK